MFYSFPRLLLRLPQPLRAHRILISPHVTQRTPYTTTAMLHSAQSPSSDPTVAAGTPGTTDNTTTQTSSSSKLIFAPGDAPTTNTPQQAGQFLSGKLDRSDLSSSPLTQFHAWFSAATAASTPHPETCTLSTAHLPSGRVSARMVYLKELDDRGFVIYSNWGTSRKAADIASNPQAALTFWWQGLERQVRVEGPAERLETVESQAYYDTRVRGSRIGAWASAQSSVLKGREELENRVKEVEKRFEGEEKIPVPEFWGGLRVRPEMVEFWQGRESRLHDRFRYTKDEGEESGWRVERLSP